MSGKILLMGNHEVGMNYSGNVYPFRQDSTFLYYFGIDLPGLAGILDCDTGEDTLLGVDPTIDDIVWTGPQPTIAELAEAVGVTSTNTFGALKSLFTKGQEIHYLRPYRYRQQVLLAEAMGGLPGQVLDMASEELAKAISRQRSIKEDEEVAELHDAVSITSRMHQEAMRFANAGVVERDVMAHVVQIALGEGAGTSFPPIVSVRGEVLHNQVFNNRLQEGQLLLVDCGAENQRHYAGDMTRTFPVSGTFTDQQKEIYSIVLEAEKQAANAIAAGKPFLENHLLAANIIAQGLIDVGLMKGNAEDAVAAGAHALFFPHGLGHMMGLDVHDMENFGESIVGYDETVQRSEQFGTNFLRLAKKLEVGNVLTVEPGIYFIPTLAESWKAKGLHKDFINYDLFWEYRSFGGIRIEEDFLVTEKGPVLLGTPCPKEIAEVEAQCQS